MIVYHGTNANIAEIDLTKGTCFKDFGQGFYVTPDLETAQRMARKKTILFGGEPTVLVYEFLVEQVEKTGLKMKSFPEKATPEWIRFIAQNRDKQQIHPTHDYDIVAGPIADDGVVVQLTNFKNEIYTPEDAARHLQDKYLDQQIYFGTTKALKLLVKTDVWKIS
ncbi:MAG: DUF3990 domain-containing protein [Bacteroidales bacterium]|nr:DUF3990 domain-containing protein [Bacteroidales bacterium]